MNIFIKDCSKHVDSEVTIKGWLYNKRSSGSIAFLQLRDGTGFIQAVVVKDGVSSEVWQKIEELTQESSVSVTGTITKHPKKDDVYEMQVTKAEIIQLSAEYPIAKKEHGPDFLVQNRHLWLRSNKQWAILKIRDSVITAINEYLHKEEFIKVDSPIITPNSCEGTTTLFKVPYFDLGAHF